MARRKQSAPSDTQQESPEAISDQPESPDVPQLDDEAARNLQQQLSEAIQPMVANLQQQITQTVQQQLGQQGRADTVESDGGEGLSLDSLGAVGGMIQSAMEAVVDIIKRIWAWINEMAGELGEQVAETIGALVGKLVQKAIKSAI